MPTPTPSTLSGARQRAVAALLGVLPMLESLAARFAAAGHELALVGGSVRDAMLGRLGADLDLTTDAHPQTVVALLVGWADTHWEVGIDFGTVGARKSGYTLEITTYRTEEYHPSSRRPAVAYGTSLVGDLARRDFTVNAMAVTLPERRFVDPYGGLADLAACRLRTPAPAEQSFDEDPLRMMRAARFAAQLGFRVDPAVIAAMNAMAARIEIVSVERVRDELTKLLLAERPRPGLTLMVDTGLAAHVLPELPALRLEIDEHHRHKDVYEHTLTVLEKAIAAESDGPDLVLRLAALLHDIGKPGTRRFEPDGGVSFHHHEVVGAAMARKRLKTLHFPSEVIDAVVRLVELHLRFHGYGTGVWTDSAVRRYVRDAGSLLDRLHTLTRSDSTTRNQRKAEALARAYDALEARISVLAEQEELGAMRPDLDGNEIMAVLGIGPGPLVGRAYHHLLEARIDSGPLGHDGAVEELRRWWADQPESASWPSASGELAPRERHA